MLKNTKKWFNDIVTEPNNSTICLIRVVAILGFIYAIVTHAYSIFHLHAVFDIQQFGISFGTMLTTLGAALGLKTDSSTTPSIVAPNSTPPAGS